MKPKGFRNARRRAFSIAMRALQPRFRCLEARVGGGLCRAARAALLPIF
jgi:hypothetical protein